MHNEDDNDILIEMEEGKIEKEYDPKEYLQLIFEELEKPINSVSFYRNVIVIDDTYCWLNANTQVARVLIFNDFTILKSFRGDFGEVVVFKKEDVDNCIDQLLDLLKKHKFIQ